MRNERRAVSRERIHRLASVVFNGEQSVFECAVRSLSAQGAMVRLSDWTALPATFALATGDGISRRVRQCWRKGDDVGVAFLLDQDDGPVPVASLAEYRERARHAATAR